MIGILKGTVHNTDRDFFAIKNLNQLTHTDVSGCLFCNDVAANFVLPIHTNRLHRAHVFNFDGIVITDTLMEAQDLLHATYAKKRFLYLYNLDWPYINNLQFTHIRSVLLNDSIELIARSKSHAQLIEQLFKAPRYIMPEWDYKTLMEIDKNG